jgi:hypothetical protein
MRYAAGRADRQERVIDLLLDETLRSLHFRQRVDRLVADAPRKPVIFASPPELVRFALSRAEERRSGLPRCGRLGDGEAADDAAGEEPAYRRRR